MVIATRLDGANSNKAIDALIVRGTQNLLTRKSKTILKAMATNY